MSPYIRIQILDDVPVYQVKASTSRTLRSVPVFDTPYPSLCNIDYGLQGKSNNYPYAAPDVNLHRCLFWKLYDMAASWSPSLLLQQAG